MKTKNIFIIVLCFVCFVTGGITFHKLNSRREKTPIRGDDEFIKQIKSIKELHTINYLFEDMIFIHRKDDPNNNLWAIIKIPVRISAFTDLERADFIIQNDTLSKIILPNAELDEPNYFIDSSMIISVRKFQFHFGSNNYTSTIKILKERIKDGKISIKNKALNFGLLNQADNEIKAYFETILKMLGKDYIPIEFKDRLLLNENNSFEGKNDSLNRIINLKF